jgi:hypothetical protein
LIRGLLDRETLETRAAKAGVTLPAIVDPAASADAASASTV